MQRVGDNSEAAMDESGTSSRGGGGCESFLEAASSYVLAAHRRRAVLSIFQGPASPRAVVKNTSVKSYFQGGSSRITTIKDDEEKMMAGKHTPIHIRRGKAGGSLVTTYNEALIDQGFDFDLI